MISIELLWQQLRSSSSNTAQIRVDAEHPLDLYADFQAPDTVGFVAICGTKPPTVRPMHALSIDEGKRSDGRWTFRFSLIEINLLPVFAALCRDIVACSRSGVDELCLGTIIVQRLIHWRTLLESDGGGLGQAVLRGLIGELLVLRDRLLPEFGPDVAIASWRGPNGAPQDFLLPTGRRLEVKMIGEYGSTVHINGLDQLDPGEDHLFLVVIRAQSATSATKDFVTVPILIDDLRTRLADQPETVGIFEMALAGVGWHDHPSHDAFAVRVVGIEDYEVDETFPRLIRTSVPPGVVDADYSIALSSGASAIADEAA
jgi:hypothetical protein